MASDLFPFSTVTGSKGHIYEFLSDCFHLVVFFFTSSSDRMNFKTVQSPESSFMMSIESIHSSNNKHRCCCPWARHSSEQPRTRTSFIQVALLHRAGLMCLSTENWNKDLLYKTDFMIHMANVVIKRVFTHIIPAETFSRTRTCCCSQLHLAAGFHFLGC